MATNETKYVTKEVLNYYDTRIKEYIAEKLLPLDDKASASVVRNLGKRVDELDVRSAVNEANIRSNKDHIDENEAAILVLQEDDKKLNQEIADLRVLLEKKLEDITPEGFITREDVEDMIEAALAEFEMPELSHLVSKDELQDILKEYALFSDVQTLTAAVVDIQTELENKLDEKDIEHLVTEEELKAALAEITHPSVDLSNYVTKDELKNVEDQIPSISHLATKQELEAAIDSIEHPVVDLSDYATKDYTKKLFVEQKYEIVPIEGMFIKYLDSEIRLNTQRVQPTLHSNVGEGGSPNMYYATLRAFAPENATSARKGEKDVIDPKVIPLNTDSYGRKYISHWIALANTSDGGVTWSKWGDTSTVDKYLGFYLNFHWYNNDTLIATDKLRIILTNDTCHDDLIPDPVARRIDDKVSGLASLEFVNTAVENVATNVTNLTTDLSEVTQQIQNIENTYVTEEHLTTNYVTTTVLEEKNYVTEQYVVNNYVTNTEVNSIVAAEVKSEVDIVVTEQIATKVETVIQEKVDAGEIEVNADAINYDTW